MKKIRVSWSVLNTWSSGRRDEAIKMMAGIEMPKNPAMIEGSRIHDIISKQKLKLIPEITDKAIFEDIVPDQKKWVNYFRVEMFPWLDLSMVIDVLDDPRIIDWKASSKRSTEHNRMQIYIYALGVEKHLGIKVNEGIFGTVKDYDGAIICTDYSAFKITDLKRELAANYVETIGSEIYDFLMNKEEKDAANT